MTKKAITRFALFAALIIALGVGTGCSRKASGNEMVEVEENYVAVEIRSASVDDLANSTRLSGKVHANEEAMVLPMMPGKVEGLYVALGDWVRKDQVLFTLDQGDILKGMDQAENAMNIAKKGIDQARNGLNSAMINYEMTKERVENAKLTLERTKMLYEAGAVPKTQLEQAEMAASEKNLEVAQGQVTQAEIAYQQALGQLRQAELSYDQARSNLDNTVVKAPISGVISTLNARVGQLASNAQAAAVILDTNPIYLQINVGENRINQLYVGQEVAVAIPSAFEGPIQGKIQYISPGLDQRTQLYTAKVYIDNGEGKIRPGMNGEILLNTEKRGNVVVVHSNAVVERDGEQFVYVVEGDYATERQVKLGLDTGTYVEVIEGIAEGEKVIVKGQHYVEDGSKVKVVRGE